MWLLQLISVYIVSACGTHTTAYPASVTTDVTVKRSNFSVYFVVCTIVKISVVPMIARAALMLLV
jgi:hypothetical protein